METFVQYLPSGNLLELGVGAGIEAHHFIEKGYGYTGIDASQTMLEVTKKNNPQATLLKASVYDLPFKSQTFDGFWAAAFFLHVPKNRMDCAFDSLKKVLKPGAVGFISVKAGDVEGVDETGRFFAYYNADKFKNILKKHNFVVMQETQRTEPKRLKIFTWLSFWVKYQPV